MKKLLSTIAVVATLVSQSVIAETVTTANGHTFEVPHEHTHSTVQEMYGSGFKMMHNGLGRMLTEEETAYVLNHLVHDLNSAGQLWGVLGAMGKTHEQQKIQNFYEFLLREFEKNSVVSEERLTYKTEIQVHLRIAFSVGRGEGLANYKLGKITRDENTIIEKFREGAFTMNEVLGKEVAGSVYTKWLGS